MKRARELNMANWTHHALIATFLLSGCGDTGSDPDSALDAARLDAPQPDSAMDVSMDTLICNESGCFPPSPCDSVTYFSGDPTPGFIANELRDVGESTPLEDMGIGHAVWGFQGGIMLQPEITVPEVALGPSNCAEIVVVHDGVDGESWAPFEVYEYRGEFGEFGFTTSLFDQISGGDPGIEGREMDLEIQVRTETEAFTTGVLRVTIEVGAPPL